jgi:AMP-activated protein kinase-like protein
MPRNCMVLASAALALTGGPLGAQSTAARVLLVAGTATDLRGVRSGAYALAPSLTLAPTPDFALSLGARGTRFTTGAWSLGGNAAATLRTPRIAGVGLVLSGNGDLSGTSYHATYVSAEAVPALEWRRGALSLWGGVHAAAARSALQLTPGTPLERTGTLTRSLWGPAFGGALQLTRAGRGASLSLRYREEHGGPAAVSLIDRAVSLEVAGGVAALSGSLGYRSASDEERTFGAARFALTVLPGVALVAAAESYPSNRLTGAAGGRAFTAGISLGIGGPHRARALPKPGGVPPVMPGWTRLALSAPHAGRVDVAGDWNAWRPVPLQRSANGVWYLDLAIAPGVYRYGFRVDGKTWEVPKEAAAVNDGFGGKSAWLSVPEPGRTATQSANRKEAP